MGVWGLGSWGLSKSVNSGDKYRLTIWVIGVIDLPTKSPDPPSTKTPQLPLDRVSVSFLLTGTEALWGTWRVYVITNVKLSLNPKPYEPMNPKP